MIKRFSSPVFRSFLFVLFLCSASLQIFSQSSAPFSINDSPLPAPTGFVNDYAGVLDANTKQQIETRLRQFKEKTNPQVEIAVAIVKATGERPIFDYSLAVARGWKIGSKETDNPSALLFIAIDDRKYFTQVSKDLEDELPDGLVGQLQRQYLVPAFKQGDYGKGVSDTIDAYINVVQSKQTGVPTQGTTAQNKTAKNSSICNIGICLIILFIILIVIFSRAGSSKNKGNDNNRWRGGGFGGGASSALPWVIGSILSGSSGGGSSSGDSSGSSGGGDSWGGFGGGGDFGGGGAGGSW